MATRIELDPQLAPALLPGRILNELYAHAREAFPEECCGLLTGVEEDLYRHAHRCRNDMNALHQADPRRHPRDATRAFHMNEHDYLRFASEAEARGERVSAVYHSHAGVHAYFSEVDQEFASDEHFPFPEADHIVVSVVDRVVKGAGLFRRTAGATGFVGRAVTAAIP